MGKKMGEETKTERIDEMKNILNGGMGFTIKSLHKRFGVSRKTILRDIRELEKLGVELVEEVLPDGTSRYTTNASTRTIQVQYNMDEVMALFLGRQLFDFLEGTSLEEASSKIFSKIETRLKKKKDIDNAKKLAQKLYWVHEGQKEYSDATIEKMELCMMGLRYEKALLVDYTNSSGEYLELTLYPFTLAAHNRGLYMVGQVPEYDNEVMEFALEKMDNVQLTGDSFVYPEGYSPEGFFRDALYVEVGTPKRVELSFDSDAEGHIRANKYHHTQKIRKKKDGSIGVTLDVYPGVEVVNWVLSFGPKVKVVNPPELINAVLDHLEDTLGRYD